MFIPSPSLKNKIIFDRISYFIFLTKHEKILIYWSSVCGVLFLNLIIMVALFRVLCFCMFFFCLLQLKYSLFIRLFSVLVNVND